MKKSVDIDQYEMITKREHLNTVITSTEASQILNVDKSYLAKLIKKGEFEHWEYRKTDKVILFRKDSILAREGRFKTKKKGK